MARTEPIRRSRVHVAATDDHWRADVAAILAQYGWKVTASGDVPGSAKDARVLIVHQPSLAASVAAARVATKPTEQGSAVLVFSSGAETGRRLPSTPPALLARLAASSESQFARSRGFVAGPFKVDLARGCAWVRGRELGLTRSEFKILAALAYRAPRAISLEEMQEVVTGVRAPVATSRIRMLVSKLRQKLGGDAARIETIIPRRYRLVISRRFLTAEGRSKRERAGQNRKSSKKPRAKVASKSDKKSDNT